MSINWVMLDSNSRDFVRLPREKILITSPPRTSLSLSSRSTDNSTQQPLSIKCNDGKAIITNQRLIYLPTTPTPTLQSLSTPLLSLQDTHVTAPFFGPNIWEAVLTPTPNGGIPPHHSYVTLRLTFKEGGAFDFHSTSERIREIISQAAEISGFHGGGGSGGGGGGGGGAGAGIIEADLEQLPAYEEAASAPPQQPVRQTPAGSGPRIQRPMPIAPNGSTVPPPPPEFLPPGNEEMRRREGPPPPAPGEAPPGYEEVQVSSVAEGLERGLRVED